MRVCRFVVVATIIVVVSRSQGGNGLRDGMVVVS